MKESLRQRIRTALVGAAVCLAVLLFGGLWAFAVLVAVAAAFGCAEYVALLAPQATPGERRYAAVWGGVVAFSCVSGAVLLPVALTALGMLVYLAVWHLGSGATPNTLGRWSAVGGAWLVVALFLGHAVIVRSHGVAPVFYVIAVVWLGDIGAYFVGSALGRHPLAPAVSPNKTLEGAAASLLCATAAGGVVSALLPVPHGAAVGALLGGGLNAAAQLGDLAESLLKRCAGVKDSGTLFPGHGGVLDRLDALLWVLPLYAWALS